VRRVFPFVCCLNTLLRSCILFSRPPAYAIFLSLGSPVPPRALSLSRARSLSWRRVGGRRRPPRPGRRRALSRVFFGAFAGDEHTSGTHTLPLRPLPYAVCLRIRSNYKCIIHVVLCLLTLIFYGQCIHLCPLHDPPLIVTAFDCICRIVI
jgi:hypothetical protein